MPEDLLLKTKKQMRGLNKRGKKSPYPQSIKDAVIELSKHMSASAIARSLGVSKTFACKTVRLAKINNNDLSLKRDKQIKYKKNDYANKSKADQNLQFVEITDQLKSVVKGNSNKSFISLDNSNKELMPTMRFTTNNGITIELF